MIFQYVCNGSRVGLAAPAGPVCDSVSRNSSTGLSWTAPSRDKRFNRPILDGQRRSGIDREQ